MEKQWCQSGIKIPTSYQATVAGLVYPRRCWGHWWQPHRILALPRKFESDLTPGNGFGVPTSRVSNFALAVLERHWIYSDVYSLESLRKWWSLKTLAICLKKGHCQYHPVSLMDSVLPSWAPSWAPSWYRGCWVGLIGTPRNYSPACTIVTLQARCSGHGSCTSSDVVQRWVKKAWINLKLRSASLKQKKNSNKWRATNIRIVIIQCVEL